MSKNTKSVVRTVVQISNSDRIVSALIELVTTLVSEYPDTQKLTKKLSGKSFKSNFVSTLTNVLQDYKDDKGKLQPAVKRVRVADPGAPKKPLSAYFLFGKDVRTSIQNENPELKMTQISKEIGARWSALADKAKKKYEKAAAAAKKEYETAMESYSPPDDDVWEELINDKSSRKKSSQLKDPDAPKKPSTAYMFFAKEQRSTVKGELESEHTDKKELNTAVSKALGARWKEMSEKDRKSYTKMAAKAKQNYDKEMESYTRPSDQEIQAKIDEKKSSRKSKSKSTPKDKDAPSKGKTAYNLYCAERRPELKAQGDLDAKEITSTMSTEWKELSDKKKKKYVKLAAADAERYKAELETYLAKKSKSKSESDSDDEEVVVKSKKSKSKSKEVVVDSESESDSDAEVEQQDE